MSKISDKSLENQELKIAVALAESVRLASCSIAIAAFFQYLSHLKCELSRVVIIMEALTYLLSMLNSK
jgi:ubiquinone biosynthesis protein UbiJ